MVSSSTRQQYLQLMGIDVWLDRDLTQRNEDELEEASETSLRSVEPQTEPAIWQDLRKQVVNCTQCELHKGRQQTVFGVGDINADWMVIGEAPGAEEDRQGEPFVGLAGKLLNAMLMAIGLHRSQVYIANILKCRPPNNRDPQADEAASCENYLKKQIALIQPKIILSVGRIASQNLLKVDTPIAQMRGQTYEYPGSTIPVVVTYHPAYLLRTPNEKRKAWQDLQLAMRIYQKSSFQSDGK